MQALRRSELRAAALEQRLSQLAQAQAELRGEVRLRSGESHATIFLSSGDEPAIHHPVEVSVDVTSTFVYRYTAEHPQFGAMTVERTGPGHPTQCRFSNEDAFELSSFKGPERVKRYYASPEHDHCPTVCDSCPTRTITARTRARGVRDFQCFLEKRGDESRSIHDQVEEELTGYGCHHVHRVWTHRGQISAICTTPVRFTVMLDPEVDNDNVWTVLGTRDESSAVVSADAEQRLFSAVSPENFERDVVRHHRRPAAGFDFTHPGCDNVTTHFEGAEPACPELAWEEYNNQATDGRWAIEFPTDHRANTFTKRELEAMTLLSIVHNLHFRGLEVLEFEEDEAEEDEDDGLVADARCGPVPRHIGEEDYHPNPPYDAVIPPCESSPLRLHSGCKCDSDMSSQSVHRDGQKLAWCYVSDCSVCGDAQNTSCSKRRRLRALSAKPWAHCYGDGYSPNRPTDGYCPTTHQCTGQPYRGSMDHYVLNVTETLGKPILGYSTRVFNPRLGMYEREFVSHPVDYPWCYPLGMYSRFMWSGLYVPGKQHELFRYDIAIPERTFGVSTDLFYAHGVQDLHVKFDLQGYAAFDASYLDGMIWFDLQQPFGNREFFPLSYGFMSIQRRFKSCLDQTSIRALQNIFSSHVMNQLTAFRFCLAYTEDRKIFLTASVSFAGVTVLGSEIHLATVEVKHNEHSGEEELSGIKSGDMKMVYWNETITLQEKRRRDEWELTKMIVQLDRSREALEERVDLVNTSLFDLADTVQDVRTEDLKRLDELDASLRIVEGGGEDQDTDASDAAYAAASAAMGASYGDAVRFQV